MALLKKGRYAQEPLVLEFLFDVTDTMVASDGSTKALGAGGSFDIVDLPPGAQVYGGHAICETAVSGGGNTDLTVAVGDSASGTRFAAAASCNAAGEKVDLLPAGYVGQGESLRITTAAVGGTPTAGKIRIRALLTISGRADQNL